MSAPTTPEPQDGDLGTYAVDGHLVIGLSEAGAEVLDLALANRHGLITGATGTGKTVTLQVLAEAFSSAGVPVFAADIKGDLSGIAARGTPKSGLLKRVREIALEGWGPQSFPTVFWDVFGEQGHPVRATVQDMGPLVISRLLDLSEAQEGVLNIAFRWAADQRTQGGRRMKELHLIDLDDLRAVLSALSERASEIRTEYGNVAPASVGAIQRRLLVLEEQGANNFFGEPALDIADFLQQAPDGRGVVNILAADKLMMTPKLYSTFLLWLLTTLYEHLPEVGDLPRPKLVFFFDEAHLLFDDAPRALLEKIEQVTRLIRSKGVGVYYVTQNPRDVPDRVSAQLGNRVQHALRAFTPQEQRGIRAAAETFRPNPRLDTEQAIKELQTGEALVSTLRGKGEPSVVQRTLIRPPMARIGPLTADERSAIIAGSKFNGKYGARTERRSAHDILDKEAGTITSVMTDLKDTIESITSRVFRRGG